MSGHDQPGGRCRPQSDASARIVSISALGEVAIAFDPGRAASRWDGDLPGTTEMALTDRVAALGDKADSVLLGLSSW